MPRFSHGIHEKYMHRNDYLFSHQKDVDILSTQAYPLPMPQMFPAHLTRREVAVLRLVACGKRNSQIAEELTISEKTVASHITHIFNKIGCENRASATAFAIHQNLA